MRNFAGALGIIVLFVAIGVGMFATFGAFGEKASVGSTPPNQEAEATQQQTQQSGQAAASIGETVTAGDVSWTVTDAGQESEVRSYTFPPREIPGRYVSMDFTVKNTSDSPVTLDEDTITLLDASGIEYRPQPDRNNSFVEHELNILFNELSLLKPGETKKGRVNVEVRPGSSGFRVLLGNTDPTKSEGKYVDLGF